MKHGSRLVRLLLAAGLLIGLLAASIAPAAAQPNPPSGEPPFVFQNPPHAFAGNGDNVIYYPWVSNGEDFGLGESLTSISVQNLENRDGQVWIYRGNGNNGWVLATTAGLSAWASKTLTAAQLGIPTGDGAPVAVVGYGATGTNGQGPPWNPWTTDYPAGTYSETLIVLSNPLADSTGQAQVFVCVANDSNGQPSPFIWTIDNTNPLVVTDLDFPAPIDGVRWVLPPWNQAQLQDALDLANSGNTGALINPFGGLNQDGDCNDSVVVTSDGTNLWDSLTLGGTAFATATADSGEADLEQLATTHTATSGYNAFNGLEIDQFDKWYLPIAQTNCGPGGCWNSVVRIANLASNNSAVTARFFPADDGSGSLQTGFQLQQLVQGGETWNIDIGNWVPQGWVGAVHIYSDGAVFAMVDRYKAGTNMWITNTGSSANFENDQNISLLQVDPLANYVLYAPHVLVDYFGWNTGINVANLVERDNNVSIQYFNLLGNATQGLSQRLSSHGMTYFYDPSDAGQNWSSQDPATDANHGVVASALIWSDYPVAAVIDATKYAESDPNGGADVYQATSYSATRNAYPWQAIPYVTKGNATDGSGATSGINFMNPNPVAAVVDVYWVNPSGFNAANFGTSVVSIPAYANGFVYTLWQHNLPNGFSGAAVAIARDGVPVIAASANVNYDVDGDGAVIYNGFNSCGFFRVEAFRVSTLQDAPQKEPRYDCGMIGRPGPIGPIDDLLPALDVQLSPEYLAYLYERVPAELPFEAPTGQLENVEIWFYLHEGDAHSDDDKRAVLLWREVEDAFTNNSEIGIFFWNIPDGDYKMTILATVGGSDLLFTDITGFREYLTVEDELRGGMADSDYIDTIIGNASELVPGGVWDLILMMETEHRPGIEPGYPLQ